MLHNTLFQEFMRSPSHSPHPLGTCGASILVPSALAPVQKS